MIAPPLAVLALVLLQSPPPAAGEWIDVFDGKTLAHLSGDPRFWSVENGAIVGRSTADTPCTRTTYLAWDGTLADFELVAEIKIDGGNSGIQYRSRTGDDFEVFGYQGDFEAGTDYSGILYEQGGRGIAAWRGEQVDFRPDGSRDVSAKFGERAELQNAIKRGDWNEYRILARGPRLVHWINGVKMVDVVDRDPQHAARSGTIALQLHQGGPMRVEVRKLRARKLDDGPSAAKPEWVWTKAGAEENEECFLRRKFTIDEPVRFAELSVSGDDRHRTGIDADFVCRGTDWMVAQSEVVTDRLAPGPHVLSIEARNSARGVGAVAAMLHVELQSGRAFTIVTDRQFRAFAQDLASWDAPAFDDSDWPAAHSFGWNVAPWSVIGDPFRLPEATPADRIEVPEGFSIERVCSAARGQGSWVSMTFDDQGRVIVSPESGRILRIAVQSGQGGTRASFEPIELPVGNAQGLLFAHGALYVSANLPNENGGGLWRCVDHDGDGRFEDSKRIVEYGPDGEHGGHGVVLGPDGWLWITNGNHTELPSKLDADSPHQDWAEDLALPREWDPNGHAVSIYAPGAYVLRVAPDGSQVKLFCAGMRNMYDLAFDEHGEAFTFDSDMEWDLGLPWYVPTRICHLVSGADFGWRSGSGRWPAWYPDALPAAVDIGLSSPTGVVFGTKAAFPGKWKRALYACDWAYGRIVAVHLEPKGSSFGGTFEDFVTGKPLPVTDLEVGPDGALWFTIGGRGAQAGLYRVTWTGGETNEPARTDDTTAAAARAERRRLEAFHGHEDPRAVEACWDALDSDDPFLRHAARVAIEAQDPKTWRDRALAEPRPTAMLTALLALARVGSGGQGDLDAILTRLNQVKLERTAASWRDEARVIEVALCRKGAPSPDVATATRDRVRAAFPSGDFELDRELFAVLHQLGDDDLPARTVPLLESLKDPVQQIQFGFDLRDVTAGWTPALSARYAAWHRGITADTTPGIAVKGFSWRGFLKQIEPALGAVGLAPAEPVAQHVDAPAATGESKWSLEKLTPDLERADHGRSFAAGKEIFTRALCANCHRFAGMGGASSLGGPDLTGVASRFSRHDLIETILAPSKVISDQYRLTEFTKKDGSVVLGRLVNEDQFTNFVLVDPLNPQRVAIDKKDVTKKRPARTSAMPERLLEPLSLDEILDLVAYLESGGDPASPRFR